MQMITMSADDFNRYETNCFDEGCAHAREKCRQWLEAKDAIILQTRDKAMYRCIDKRESDIKTLMGEVTYSRHYYKAKDALGARYVFLLDEMLGLGECGQMSASLTDVIVDECMNTSFRKSAKAVSMMTGQRISHGGAWRVLQERGARVAKEETRLAELSDMGALHGESETKVLFEEVDGVWLPMQGKDRPKKTGKREIKVSTQYSGWKETARGRYETVGKVAYAGFDEPREFYRRRDARMACKYDVDEICVRIVNGDGASWIRGADEDAVMQLDPFHRSRAIMRGLPDKAARAEVNRLFRDKDVRGALKYIEDLLDKSADEKEAKRIGTLLTYLNDNRDNLLTWDERGISLPPPPDGIVYRRLGTQEHANCDLITHRMKRRKASWSVKGGGHMAKLLCRRATNGLEGLFHSGITGLASPITKPLAAAKAPVYDGKGNGGRLPRGGWPYEGAARTEGRKAVKNIFHHRHI